MSYGAIYICFNSSSFQFTGQSSVTLSVLIKYLQVPANGVPVTFGVTSIIHPLTTLCKIKLVNIIN